MKRLALVRTCTSDAGTFGRLILPFAKSFHTAELPWRKNTVGLSCIPSGRYVCEWRKSPQWGWSYEITDVPGRTHILFHRGNWAGDRLQGFKCDVKGCVMLGASTAPMEGQMAVWNSKPSIATFHSMMNEKPFQLDVLNLFEL